MSDNFILETNRLINNLPLFAVGSYKTKKNTTSGFVNLNVPTSYISKLTEALQSNNEHLATINFTIYPTEIDIEYFKVIINDSRFRPIATKEEMDALQGIGKILLCKLLQYFLNIHKIVPKTVIKLEASPFLSCAFHIDKTIFEKYDARYSDETAIEYLSQYPNIYKTYLLEIKQLEDRTKIRQKLLFNVCYLQHLLSLVEYYKKLNFKPDLSSDSEYGESVEMSSTVSRVLESNH